MDVKALRGALLQRKASWSLAPIVADATDLFTFRQPQYQLGALPAREGMRTQLFPRLRRRLDSLLVLPRLPGPRLPGLRLPGSLRLDRLPAQWDWRSVDGHNYVTAARSQGGCGSCVAFATAGAIEAHYAIQQKTANPTMDLSESSLFFVADRQCNAGDPRYGWWVPSAMDQMVNEGICFESNYPYRDVNQAAEIPNGSERTLKIRGYDSTSDTAQMKRWLVEEGPLVTAFTVHSDFFAYWNSGSGVYSHVTGNSVGGHAVLVVGYDDNAKAWICKNSWGNPIGANNGEGRPDGCFQIGYGECSIDSRMYVPQDVYDVLTRDELPYDPNKLRIIDEGTKGWLLTDGVSRMKIFDTKEDARNGLCVARRHTRHGFVGRDNPRSNREDYIIEYWAGTSGLPWEPLTRTDAIPYNPAEVVAEDLNDAGWRIRSGNSSMLMAHDMNDALAALQEVERHSRMCFIGRNNQRPNRHSYIMTYWE